MTRPPGSLGGAGGTEPRLEVEGGDAPILSSSEPPYQVLEISLAEIVATSSTQMRVVGIDPGTVFNYAEDMQGGATFPPVKAYHDGTHYYLSDGFHRVEAARRIGRGTIPAEVRQGTSRDATLAACAANATHGLRRTHEDKRRAITAMLTDPEWAKWSDRAVAKSCMVDHKSVAKIRRELTAPKGGEIPTSASAGASALPNGSGEIPTGGSMVARMLASIATDALIAEVRRRGLEVRDA
jgi:ParB-like nuclease domain